MRSARLPARRVDGDARSRRPPGRTPVQAPAQDQPSAPIPVPTVRKAMFRAPRPAPGAVLRQRGRWRRSPHRHREAAAQPGRQDLPSGTPCSPQPGRPGASHTRPVQSAGALRHADAGRAAGRLPQRRARQVQKEGYDGVRPPPAGVGPTRGAMSLRRADHAAESVPPGRYRAAAAARALSSCAPFSRARGPIPGPPCR